MTLTPATIQAPRLDATRAGKRCGGSYIAAGLNCTKPAALTPATVSPKRQGTDWRRKAATVAGVTAAGLAVGLPAAGFFVSGSPAGRRASRGVEQIAREAGKGLMSWGSGPLAPIGVPLGMGAMAGAEGARAGRTARRIVESWRSAPGFAKSAAGLAGRKSRSAEARRAYIEKLQQLWLASNKPITPAEARRRAAEVRKVELQIALLSRQAATRAQAARRAARIARTGAPFRQSPTVSERWLRESLLSPDPSVRRPVAALTAGAISSLQSTKLGLSSRRPRFYGARRDAEGGRPRARQSLRGRVHPPRP